MTSTYIESLSIREKTLKLNLVNKEIFIRYESIKEMIVEESSLYIKIDSETFYYPCSSNNAAKSIVTQIEKQL